MTYSSRKFLISPGLGSGGRVATDSACWSSVMISLQMSMHSLQMYTVGPAMSFFTSFCDLPQKEQRRVSSVRLTIAEGNVLEKSATLLWSNHRRFGNFCASDDLVVTTNAFVTDECALAYHPPGHARHSLWCARHNLRTLTLRSIAK